MIGAHQQGHEHQQIIRDRVAESDSGCWLWQQHVDRYGYARITYGRKVWLAHRLAFEAFVGPIPEGMTLDHLCRVRSCVNPAHLDPVTNAENTRRGYEARGFARKPERVAPKRPYLSRSFVTNDDPRHGTYSGYNNLSCRCQRCLEAARAYRRAKKAKGPRNA